MRAASERLGIPRLAISPRTALYEILARQGCDTARCLSLMCGCEDENIKRMVELWEKLNAYEQRMATVDDLAYTLDIKIADIVPVISHEISRMAKFEADIAVGLRAATVVSKAIDRALSDEQKGNFKYSEMVLKIPNIVPIPKSSTQVNIGTLDAREQKQLNQVVIPSLEEVVRSREEGKAIPGRETPLLDE